MLRAEFWLGERPLKQVLGRMVQEPASLPADDSGFIFTLTSTPKAQHFVPFSCTSSISMVSVPRRITGLQLAIALLHTRSEGPSEQNAACHGALGAESVGAFLVTQHLRRFVSGFVRSCFTNIVQGTKWEGHGDGQRRFGRMFVKSRQGNLSELGDYWHREISLRCRWFRPRGSVTHCTQHDCRPHLLIGHLMA